MLNSNDPLRASGIVALDLFNEFKRRGNTVKLLVYQYAPNYPEDIICIESFLIRNGKWFLEKFTRRLKILMLKLRLKKKDTITDPIYHFHELDEEKSFYKTKKILKRAGIVPDVIIILFAKNLVSAKNMYELNKITGAPVFWLMYDMAPMTGGCHYAWDCKGYLDNCGNCPGLFSSDPFDITYRNLSFRKNFIAKTNIRILTGSEWQYNQAKTSSIFKNKPIYKIFTSFDPTIFKPTNKEELRSKLNIATDKKVVFFGSVELWAKRKGMHICLESLKLLKELIGNSETSIMSNNILLLIAGKGIDEIADSLPFDFHYMGEVNNTYGIASAFQAADVFLCPSIEDSGPTMINQSIMCGTPVVSFEMGIAMDLVKNDETGYRVRLKDSMAFAQAIFKILCMSDSELSIMRTNCRNLALELYSSEVNFNNWINILNDNNVKN